MKRFFCLLLSLCLFAGIGSALALDLPDDDALEQLGLRLLEQWDDLALKEKLEAMDDVELAGLAEELKALARESETLSDEELAARLREIAEAHGISPEDAQLRKLIRLLRSYEKGTEIKEKAEDAKEKATGFLQSLRNYAHKAASFFQKLSDLLKKL